MARKLLLAHEVPTFCGWFQAVKGPFRVECGGRFVDLQPTPLSCVHILSETKSCRASKLWNQNAAGHVMTRPVVEHHKIYTLVQKFK